MSSCFRRVLDNGNAQLADAIVRKDMNAIAAAHAIVETAKLRFEECLAKRKKMKRAES